MGQLAQAAQGRQLRKADPQGGFKALLEKAWPRIAAVMPSTMSPNRMFQLAMSTYNSDPLLAQCSPQSILSCLMKCGALGLEPSNVDGLGRAYILPFKNWKTRRYEATFILGYKGMIDLARRSGELMSIHAQAVYEGDEFERWEDMDGQHFRWVPKRDAPHDPEHLTDVYMVAKLKDGGTVFESMTKAEVEDIRKRSKASDKGPWATDYEAMALKTVIRRSFKYLPVSIEAQQAAVADEQTPDYSSVLNPVFETYDAPEDAPESEQGAVSDQIGELVTVDTATGEIVAENVSEGVAADSSEDAPV